jgi:hypothetical protein
MKVVPSLKDVTWLDDFREPIEKEEKDKRKVYKMVDFFKRTYIECTLVKIVSIVGEVNEEDWVIAVTILSCLAKSKANIRST